MCGCVLFYRKENKSHHHHQRILLFWNTDVFMCTQTWCGKDVYQVKWYCDLVWLAGKRCVHTDHWTIILGVILLSIFYTSLAVALNTDSENQVDNSHFWRLLCSQSATWTWGLCQVSGLAGCFDVSALNTRFVIFVNGTLPCINQSYLYYGSTLGTKLTNH